MRREAAYSVPAPQSPLGSGSSPRPYSATTELEDQISALLRSEPAYSPSTCASSSSPLGAPMDLGVVVRRSAENGGAASSAAASSSPVVPHDEWRARIADWSYRVVDHFRYDREVVSVSMNYFDRFLLLTKTDNANGGGIVAANAEKDEMSCDAPLSPTSSASAPNGGGGGAVEGERDEEIDSRTYQLAAMTSLYLAVKLHGEQPEETPPPEAPSSSSDAASAAKPSSRCGGAAGAGAPVSPARRPPPENRRKRRRRRRLRLLSFVELSRGQFNAEDITGMESRMLNTLRWRVNPPTPMVFVSYLLRLLPASPPAHSVIHRPREFGMTEAEYRDSIHEERQRHDLVLHILHELSRYLAELSVCLSDVSASHDPSTLAYAAVLVSAECLTSEALPPSLLDDFLGDVESLSPKLARDSPDVTYLVGRMKEAFLPELLLDGTSSACNAAADGAAASEGTGHPIAIAREAGLLDVDALYGRGGGPDGSEDVQTDAGYEYCESQYEENLKRQQRRNDSSCCVIEGALRNDQALRGSPKRPQGKAVSVEDEEQDSPVCVSRHAVVLKN